MTDNEKTRSGAGTPKREEIEIEDVLYIPNSTPHFSTMGFYGQAILSCLEYEKENAITAEKIAERVGTDVRAVTRFIERARRDGIPICAYKGTTPGYYLTDSPEELTLYIKTLERYIKNESQTIESLYLTRDKMSGQQTLWR
jgi:biotin operon repressor